MYYSVKIRLSAGEKEMLKLYLVNTSEIEEVLTVISKNLQGQTYKVSSINETGILKVFEDNSTNPYWKAKLVWETPDGKKIKEEYAIQTLNINEGNSFLIKNVSDCNIENIESMMPLNIVEVLY
ncbi:MAG: hypothetical protein WC942_10570 [Clostridia bacterium]|jgi:hypothetical protein